MTATSFHTNFFNNLSGRFIFLFCIISFNGFSQECEIKNIVFEGAGIRGIAYAGVIAELEKHHKINNIEKVGGTSAGAITALMLSLSYSSQEMADIVSGTNFKKFNDGRFMFFGGINRMKNKFGWYRGDKFTKWISEIIENKTGNPDITFEELHLKGYKDLYVTATCINKQKLLVFSRENYPKMKVKDAVRISISIPLYFKAVFIDSAGAVYNKPDDKENLDIVVDGGIIGNFPIFIFDETEIDSSGRENRIPDTKTLGVRIDSEVQIQNDASSRSLVHLDVNNFKDYISAFYILIIENLNRKDLTENDWKRTLSISSAGISPRIKKLSKEQKDSLISSGRAFTSNFLQNNCDGLNNKE